MTRAERERKAVAEHSCPRCYSQAHFRCTRSNGRSFIISRTYIAHPHAERVALVQEDSS